MQGEYFYEGHKADFPIQLNIPRLNFYVFGMVIRHSILIHSLKEIDEQNFGDGCVST